MFSKFDKNEDMYMHYIGTIDDAYKTFGWKKNE